MWNVAATCLYEKLILRTAVWKRLYVLWPTLKYGYYRNFSDVNFSEVISFLYSRKMYLRRNIISAVESVNFLLKLPIDSVAKTDVAANTRVFFRITRKFEVTLVAKDTNLFRFIGFCTTL